MRQLDEMVLEKPNITTYHICQSVSGALRNWSKIDWDNIGADNGITGAVLKERFRIMDFNGIKVIPLHERCDGFDDIKGCPGHPKE